MIGENTSEAIRSRHKRVWSVKLAARRMNDDSSHSRTRSLEEARRGYAFSKVTALSSQLQETSVAKFEVDHLPERRKVGLCCCFTLCAFRSGASSFCIAYTSTS